MSAPSQVVLNAIAELAQAHNAYGGSFGTNRVNESSERCAAAFSRLVAAIETEQDAAVEYAMLDERHEIAKMLEALAHKTPDWSDRDITAIRRANWSA